jgi:hypothetical protein
VPLGQLTEASKSVQVRGTFCDLQNWLYFNIGPSFYEEPYLQNEQSISNWDGRACGYNTIQPTHLSFIHVPPNPFQVHSASPLRTLLWLANNILPLSSVSTLWSSKL